MTSGMLQFLLFLDAVIFAFWGRHSPNVVDEAKRYAGSFACNVRVGCRLLSGSVFRSFEGVWALGIVDSGFPIRLCEGTESSYEG